MFSWFSRGNSEPTKAVTAAKKPTNKPPVKKATQWQQNHIGEWKRVSSSLAGTSTNTKKPAPSVRGPKRSLLDDVPPEDNSQDNSQPDSDTNSDIPPVPTPDDKSYDELAKFQRKLTVKIFTLEKLLEELDKKKVDLKGGLSGKDKTGNSKQLECPNGKLKKLSTRIFHAVKECVEPANEELDDLLSEIRPHLDDLCGHINTLCESLNEPVDKVEAGHHKTDEEKRLAGIEICDICIELATELKDFLANILAEIDLCLQSEKLGEIALNLVVQFAIFLATSRTLGFNITFAQPYRNSLNQRIEKEKIDIEIFETDAAGNLKKAVNSLNQLQLELQSALTAKASNTGMFAGVVFKNESKPVADTSIKLAPKL